MFLFHQTIKLAGYEAVRQPPGNHAFERHLTQSGSCPLHPARQSARGSPFGAVRFGTGRFGEGIERDHLEGEFGGRRRIDLRPLQEDAHVGMRKRGVTHRQSHLIGPGRQVHDA